jgi:hypothetical protein
LPWLPAFCPVSEAADAAEPGVGWLFWGAAGAFPDCALVDATQEKMTERPRRSGHTVRVGLEVITQPEREDRDVRGRVAVEFISQP